MKQNKKIISIVGNSRSGTTMMGRVLNQNPNIFTFDELHFYGMLYSPAKDAEVILEKDEATKLLSKLFCLQRNGFFSNCDTINNYHLEAENIVTKEKLKTYEDIYTAFLFYETSLHNKSIPCEQTPKNLFFLNNIFQLNYNIKIINMMRDPRDVLNSQKSKWKRRFLGASAIPYKEAIRAWFNYHPITIALLWRSSIREYEQSKSLDKPILNIKFEDLLLTPVVELQKICTFIEIEYSNNMLNIPQIGSSDGQDSKNLGVNKSRINPWKNSKNISKTEIYICEKICFNEMRRFGYESSNIRPNKLIVLYYYFTFPLKMSISLLLNLKRLKNIVETIKKYFL